MMDNKGYTYCTKHGEQRKKSTPTHKLTKSDIAQLEVQY